VPPSSPSKKDGGSGGKHIGLTITVSGSPSASASGPSGSSPGGNSPAPGRSTQPAPNPSPSSSPSPSPQGSLVVSTGQLTLTTNADGSLSGAFTITAQGGDVSSISIANPSAGLLLSYPGSLSSGQSATVSLSVSASSVSGLSSETDLTVSPGGQAVVVDAP
jgi:hypothetical protein